LLINEDTNILELKVDPVEQNLVQYKQR